MIEESGVISLKDVRFYFDENGREGSKEETDLFIDRMLEEGFDSSVDLKLRYKLNIWALSEPGYDAGAAAVEVDAHLAGTP